MFQLGRQLAAAAKKPGMLGISLTLPWQNTPRCPPTVILWPTIGCMPHSSNMLDSGLQWLFFFLDDLIVMDGTLE